MKTARVIQTGPKRFNVPNETGYSLNSRKSLRGAVRLAHEMYGPGPVMLFRQGPMHYGRAELIYVETIGA